VIEASDAVSSPAPFGSQKRAQEDARQVELSAARGGRVEEDLGLAEARARSCPQRRNWHLQGPTCAP
jgi:hypothetical protein